MKNRNFFWILVGAATVFFGCQDDVNRPGNCGGQTCNENEACINDACINTCQCTELETCIKGECIANTRVCGEKVCQESELCLENECIDPSLDACQNACKSTETCLAGECVPNNRVCGAVACKENQDCVQFQCVAHVEDPCGGRCNMQEVCRSGDCVPAARICGEKVCTILENCEDGLCVEDLTKKPCDPACTSDKTCRLGTCIAKNRICGEVLCDEGMLCANKDKVCASPERICNDSLCEEGQVCQHGACTAIDLCGNVCAIDEVCVQTTCVKKSDFCGEVLCDVNEICQDNHCVDKCNAMKCEENEICMGGACLPKLDSGLCETECEAHQTCYGTECIDTNRICGNALCPENRVCDTSGEYCSRPCEDGREPCWGTCCEEGFVCSPEVGHCTKVCNNEQTSCRDRLLCCDPGYLCENGYCRITCGDRVRCGANVYSEVCCQAGEVCEANKCKPPCSGTRCGANEELCCNDSSELCLYQQCLPRGKTCTTSNDCDMTEFCEETSKTCVNADADPNACLVKPTPGKFSPLVQWFWPKDHNNGKPVEYPDYVRVIVVPLLANFTDDNNDGKINTDDIPDVVFISYSQKVSPDTQAGSVIRVLSGEDGREITSSAPRYWTYPTSLALGDVDNDGIVEIVAGTNKLNPDYLEVLQVVKNASSPTGYSLKTKYQIQIGNGSKAIFTSIADIDADGTPEIISNLGVCHVTSGQLKWVTGCQKTIGTAHAADLDGDGQMELISSSAIMDNKCNTLVGGGSGGQIAIADFMPSNADAATTGELVPEVVFSISGMKGGKFEFWKIFKNAGKWSWKRVWQNTIPINAKRAKALGYDCSLASPPHYCNSGGGHPVVADFNGDGKADVGVAGRWYYIVYSNDGTPNGGKVLWADGNTQDFSSAVTSSSVFDFEGDGIAEVVYADETKLHIYSGLGSGVDKDGDGYNDPKEIWNTASSNWTGYEYPIVVDCDNDGSTEIIVVSDHGTTVGVRAFEDPGGQWVRTRRIWNQHMYHVSNIDEDGRIPQHEKPHWLQKRLNSYRQNIQPSGMFNAPNLVSHALTFSHDYCPKIHLTANVSNEGSLGIKAGLSVKFYVDNVNGTGKIGYLGEAQVPQVLPPGASGAATLAWNGSTVNVGGAETTLSLPADIYFVVDEPTVEKTQGEFVECIESDNNSKVTKVTACKGVN